MYKRQGCDRVLVVLTRPREYRRRPDKLLPLVRKKYREYPNFVAAMEQRAQVYNQDREELFRAEREGRLLVIAPRSTLGVSRTERNTEKLRLLWAAGYQDAVDPVSYTHLPQKRFTMAGQTYPEPSPYDRLILDRRVRFVGDAVAIVAGEDEGAVDRALKRIRVRYQVLQPCLLYTSRCV